MNLIISVICTIALLSGPALAQKAPPRKATPAAAAKAKAKAKKASPKRASSARCKKGEQRTAEGCVRVKDVDFVKGDSIDGESPEGYGEVITGNTKINFGGLIRLRTHFHDKILKSVERL